jgi:hypothetical protein
MCDFCAPHETEPRKVCQLGLYRVGVCITDTSIVVTPQVVRHHGGNGAFSGDVMDERTDYAKQPLHDLVGDWQPRNESIVAAGPITVDLLLNARVVDIKKRKSMSILHEHSEFSTDL